MLKDAVLIAGPTASGKSALALEIARAEGRTIVNADSMQVYSVLRVLTARPGPDEAAAAPHLLYGHVHPTRAYSTGEWLRDVEDLIESGTFERRSPVFVGGTGLYFKALTEGLSQMPEIPPVIRERWRGRLAQDGPRRVHAVLAERDPDAAAVLRPADGQRIVRALEVLDASGRSILDWQAKRDAPLVDAASARLIVVEPDREWLGRRIEQRFASMVEEGALEEVRALLALDPDPALPAMKAIGVRELREVLEGAATPAQAMDRAATVTRQYAKRQSTWFRNQLDAKWQSLPMPQTADAGAAD